MPSETKAGTSRRKSSTETKVAAPKTAKKTSTKVAATVKTAAKAAPVKTTKAEKPVPAKVEKTAAKPAAKKPAVPRKAKATGQPITADARLRHIEIAAYYIAEKSGFSRNPSDCWIAAESEVDSLLLSGKLSG